MIINIFFENEKIFIQFNIIYHDLRLSGYCNKIYHLYVQKLYLIIQKGTESFSVKHSASQIEIC